MKEIETEVWKCSRCLAAIESFIRPIYCPHCQRVTRFDSCERVIFPDQATELERVKYLLGQIIQDLPKKRDWLNPDIEREARAILDL